MPIASKEDLKNCRGIVYLIVNKAVNPSKVYVGTTRNTFNERYKGDWSKWTKNIHLKRAVKKYGKDAFEIHITDKNIASQEDLDLLEKLNVKLFSAREKNLGYNFYDGGSRAQRHSERVIALQRAKQRRFTTETFKEKLKELYGDEYDLSRIEYSGRVNMCGQIGCKKHGFKDISAITMLNGLGCKKCRSEKRLKEARKELLKKVLLKFSKVREDQYDYSLITEYVDVHTPLPIKCKKHDIIFNQTANNHLRGEGCPKCGREETSEKQRNYTTETFKTKLKEIYSDRYDLSKIIYKKSGRTHLLGCGKHGFVKTSYAFLISGKGCRKCFLTERRISNQSWEQTKEKIQFVLDGGILAFPETYEGFSKKMKFKCQKCEKIFYRKPNDLCLIKVGACKECSLFKNRILKINKISSEIIKEYLSCAKAVRENIGDSRGLVDRCKNKIKKQGFFEHEDCIYKEKCNLGQL